MPQGALLAPSGVFSRGLGMGRDAVGTSGVCPLSAGNGIAACGQASEEMVGNQNDLIWELGGEIRLC